MTFTSAGNSQRDNDASNALRVSVIVPTFNCERYIREALISILSQSESRLEVIVVDDGSTDGTVSRVMEIANADDRVNLLKIAHTGYPGIVRNHGIKSARAPFVTFLDSDDSYHPQRIERALAVFDEHPALTLVFHDHVRFWHDEDPRDHEAFLGGGEFVRRASEHLDPAGPGVYLCVPSFYSFMSLEQIPMWTGAVMVRAEQLRREKGFSEVLRHHQDEDLWFRLVLGGRTAYLDQPLCYYRLRPGSQSWNIRERGDRSKTEMAHLCDIQLHEQNYFRGARELSTRHRKAYRGRIARGYQDLAYHYVLFGNAGEERRALRRAWGWDRSLSVVQQMCKSFIPKRARATLRTMRIPAAQSGHKNNMA